MLVDRFGDRLWIVFAIENMNVVISVRSGQNFPLLGEHLLEIALRHGQFAVGFWEAMRIWQFAILILIMAGAIWLAIGFYGEISREVEFVIEHQQM